MPKNIIPTNFDKATLKVMLLRDDLEIKMKSDSVGGDKWEGKDSDGHSFDCDFNYDEGYIGIILNGKTVADFTKSFATVEYEKCQSFGNDIARKYEEQERHAAEQSKAFADATKGLTPEQIQQLRDQGMVK